MDAAKQLVDRRLVNPPDSLVKKLANEEGVATRDVVQFLNQLAGLTEDEAFALVDDLRYRRSWNTATYMAVMEGLDSARLETRIDSIQIINGDNSAEQ